MFSTRSKARAGITAATTVAALFAAGAPAMASEAPDPADATAAVIDQAAPNQGDVVDLNAEGDTLAATTSNTAVDVPVSPSNDLTVGAPGTTTAPDLSVSLPAELDLKSATVADDGTVLYPAADGDTSAAVQVLDNGSTRIQTVIPDAKAKRKFTYTFGKDVTPVLRPDGGADLTVQADNALLVVGSVDAPWATDANGEPVDTHYQIDGKRLIQIVTPGQNTAFPVVADPKLTYTWWNVTIYFNKSETGVLAVGVAAAATALSKIPVAGTALSIYATAIFGVAGVAKAEGKCAKLVSYGLPPLATNYVPQIYSGSEAGGYCR